MWHGRRRASLGQAGGTPGGRQRLSVEVHAWPIQGREAWVWPPPEGETLMWSLPEMKKREARGGMRQVLSEAWTWLLY